MKSRLTSFILILILNSPLLAQKSASTEPASSAAMDILLKQVQSKQDQQNSSQNLNERIGSLAKPPKTINEYLLGPGDAIELTIVGIPGLDKKDFALDGQGKISVPYLGQVELLGLTAREVESKLIKLFSASLLEDPQVTVSIREYRSQYYYVMGAVLKPGKYPLTQSTDILDALALAGGLTEKADSKIRIYRLSQAGEAGVEVSGKPIPSKSLEIRLPELLQQGQGIYRMAILSGDVVEVQESKERTYYVLGDVLRPGAFPMRPSEPMALTQALGNAGGMLKTASGDKVWIIRQKAGSALPEQIKVNAYAMLKGDMKDIELLENDTVLVPGSASKTLGKSFLSGIGGIITTLLLLGAR